MPKKQTDIVKYSKNTLGKASRLFWKKGMPLDEISIETGIPVRDLEKRAKADKWIEKRRSHVAAVTEEANNQLKLFVAGVRVESLQKQYKAGTAILQKLSDLITNAENPSSMEIQRLSKSFNELATALQKVVGVSERGLPDTVGENKPPANLFLTNVYPTRGAPSPGEEKEEEIKKSNSIDAEYEEINDD